MKFYITIAVWACCLNCVPRLFQIFPYADLFVIWALPDEFSQKHRPYRISKNFIQNSDSVRKKSEI